MLAAFEEFRAHRDALLLDIKRASNWRQAEGAAHRYKNFFRDDVVPAVWHGKLSLPIEKPEPLLKIFWTWLLALPESLKEYRLRLHVRRMRERDFRRLVAQNPKPEPVAYVGMEERRNEQGRRLRRPTRVRLASHGGT